MKILFVVCGEGLGHASRCLHLGHFMEEQGHAVHYAGYGKSYTFMNQHGCSVLHRVRREVCLQGKGGFFSMKRTLWHSKFLLLDLIRSAARVFLLIREHQYDCVVCDTMYGGVLAARLQGVPVVFITNQNHFCGPNGKTNPLWRLLSRLVRGYLRLAKKVIIPDFPPPNTISQYNIRIPGAEKKRYRYTGPFYMLDPDQYVHEQKTIFASFGGEPYKLPMYLMLREVAGRHRDETFDVFSTTPGLPVSSGNFLTHGFVTDLYEHMAAAKVAIVHGGLTTLHETQSFRKPVLIILDPKHPEQQNNAQKIVEMGAGISIDGRSITPESLEEKLAEAMKIVPRPFPAAQGSVNGREKATEIILAVAGRRQC
jgi:uncharacterized protein (TIGR00661 family)